MNDLRMQEDTILRLVRSSDPLVSSPVAPSDRAEDLLRQIVATERSELAVGHRDRFGRKRLLVAIAVAIVVGAAGTGAAFATGLIGANGGIQAARIFASTTGVANVHTVAVSASGSASVAEGVKDGVPVAAATIGDSTLPFVPLTTLLAGRDIAVQTGSGGSAGSVDWIAAAGVVSQRVARVDIDGQDGAVQPVNLTSGTFAVELQPTFQPVKIVAYDKAGQEVARVPFPAEQAPTP